LDVSVLIPTCGRPDKVSACIRALAAQKLEAHRYEVLIGLDGPDDLTAGALRSAWPAGRSESFKLVEFSKRGQAAVRNGLLKLAVGRTLVFLNDDMLPGPGLLEAHRRAQAEREAIGRPALVIGDSPWVVHTPDRLFDRLVRETSMVFFYNVMNLPEARAERDRDWGFRHAWLLNLSAPAALVREAGGFTVFPSTYGYEDDELAWRMSAKFGMPVLYRPEAVARHDHRMDPADYLQREYKLGFAAWGFARTTPECALAMFRRDVTSSDEVAYCRQFLERERGAAERLERSFLGLADRPASAAGDDPAILNLIYEQHLLLKRWHWRRGLADAAGSDRQ
jgi:GT2 family glycosyltransferase